MRRCLPDFVGAQPACAVYLVDLPLLSPPLGRPYSCVDQKLLAHQDRQHCGEAHVAAGSKPNKAQTSFSLPPTFQSLPSASHWQSPSRGWLTREAGNCHVQVSTPPAVSRRTREDRSGDNTEQTNNRRKWGQRWKLLCMVAGSK